jgi:tetratricopeptide (TPR) repeat protein
MAVQTRRINPYIAGKSLGGQRGFFGRDDILRLVETRLRAPDQSALVLYGQRRIGKTSILLQLQHRLPAPPFLPVYFDLMDRARRPLGQVLFEIATTIAEEAGIAPPDPAEFDDQGLYFRRSFLPSLYQALGEGQIPVLLFDEFDVLDIAATEQLPPTAAAQAFFPYLRELLEGEPRLKFIFVVGRRAEDLSIIVKSLFKASISQRVSVLDPQSANNLIRTAQRQGSLGFSRIVVERIMALTAGHPYFTQLICQILWDNAYSADPQTPPSIQQLELVEDAADKSLEAGQNIFEWIWDGLPPAERVIFAAIASATNEHSVVTEEQLTQLLQSQGIRILTGELELAPRTLVEWEMLRQVDGGYQFFIELMRRWVATSKPLARVRDELDRIVPLAETLFRSAEAFYRQRDLENAQNQLRQALRVNPNHLKARLLVAQVLLEENRLEEAIADLEEAYRYGEEQARYALVHGLLARGEALEQAADDEGALEAYERALEVSPRETVARERRDEIWRRRGLAALKADDLQHAQQAYERAGDSAEVKRITELGAQRMLEQAIAAARSHEQREDWEQATRIYQRLMAQNPADTRWHEAIGRTKAEQKLKLSYGQAVEALDQRNWPQAIIILSELGQARPGYKDAARLRNQAQQSFNAEVRAREQSEDWGGAEALYRALAEHMPQEEQWRREIARLASERELGEQYAAGLVAVRQRNWDQALESLSGVVRARPSYRDAEKLLHRAERGRQGKPSSLRLPGWAWVCIAMLMLAVGVGAFYTRPYWRPITASEYFERGLSRKTNSSYDLAITDFTQAIALQPDYADAYHQRGIIYVDKGFYQQAIEDFTREIEIDAQRTQARSSRASAYMQLQQCDQAIGDYTILIDTFGETKFYSLRAAAYTTKSDFQNAEADYNKAIELNPNDSSLFLQRGNVLAQKGDNPAAITDFSKVLEISASDSEKAEAQKQLDVLGAQ